MAESVKYNNIKSAENCRYDGMSMGEVMLRLDPRELMRLLRSLSKRGVAEQVGARGCAAAFGAYCAGDRALRRQLLMSRAWEERRNALHALAYRKPPPPAASTSGADPGG